MVVAGLTVAAPISVAAQRTDLDSRSVLTAEIRAQEEVAVLIRFSLEHRPKVEALLESAKRKSLPTKPLIDRMALGQQRGLSESAITAAASEQFNRLEAAYWALVHAGRDRPDPLEVSLGASVLDRGASTAQLESVGRTAQPARSLVVALEVLAKLTERGLPVDNAVAQVSGKLVSGASDGDITSLLSRVAVKS
jgi:hypothetical protein